MRIEIGLALGSLIGVLPSIGGFERVPKPSSTAKNVPQKSRRTIAMDKRQSKKNRNRARHKIAIKRKKS